MKLSRARLGASCIALATLAPLACSDATDVELIQISASGVLLGQAFLDLDGNGIPSGADEPLDSVQVFLVTSTTAEVVLLTTTDSAGAFTLFDVPVGTYRLALAPETVGDSLQALGGTPVSIALGDTSRVDLGVTYPTWTIEEALAQPVGTRLFTSGIALNQRLNFDPTGQVHFAGATGFLRALDVDRATIATGDSVRLLGRVVLDNGRAALAPVTPTVLVNAAALPIPTETTPGQAASAGGGPLDAALVRIRNVEITDTSTNLDGHFRFWAVFGSDSVEIMLREFLGLNTSGIRPDTILRISQATGLLSPVDEGGAIRWRILPRTGSDLVLETRTADIAVTVSADTATASLGDTIETIVVAANNGPLSATSLVVRDTVPSAMAFISAEATSGTYDSETGLWSVGDLGSGAADTLRVRLQLTNDTPFSVRIAAESRGSEREVDPVPGNNQASFTILIS